MSEELPQVHMRDGVPHIFYDGWELILTRDGYDGVPLLFVDTDGLGENERGPRCRILLNDEPVWENPPFSLPDDPAQLDPADHPVEVQP